MIISTDKTVDNKPLSYEIFEDGYAIYLEGKIWITQRGQYSKPIDKTKSFEENCLLQIEELAGGNSFVSFYKSKNNSFSLVFGKSQAELVAALQQLATDSELVLGEMADEKRPLAKGSAR